ncbi:epidermal growth factor receptor kinase substrate 8-like protein 3b [Odontesthes bonariensis]|uniref:epidermal growth factor receptor kinase substrate 8-like protein 3b n=1 Tax=Odontesthes bonariensis TaxID=219752 RepID=UPI003F58E88A
MTRPSGRSIYMQRKEYAETLSRQPDNFQVRVEHLLTCELDGQEMRTVNECVAKLKRLDGKGRLWPQEMIMEIQGANLRLSDIETKVELDSIPLSCITETKAVLDSCVYNSLLTLIVQERSKRVPQVFMFQCEETGAEDIKADLDKAAQSRGGNLEPYREPFNTRRSLENNIGQQASGSFHRAGPRPMQREMTPPPPDPIVQQWDNIEPDYMPSPKAFVPQDEMMHHNNLHEMQSSPVMAPEKLDVQRNMDILNHVIGDLEIFMGKAAAAAASAPSLEENMGKSKKKKKSKKKAPSAPLPSWEEYVSCLQKIKYGFNLLGQLDGVLSNPSAPDFVHIFFTNLDLIVRLYPPDVPPTVVSPLLTDMAVQLLGQVVGEGEEYLWRSLGDCWIIPRSNWRDDVPPYIPEFYDGWQPPAPPHIPSSLSHQNGPLSRSNSQRFPGGPMNEGQGFSPRVMHWQPEEMEEPMASGPRSSPPSEQSLQMRVMYNFMARNNRELSIMKGEVVEVIQKSKQWWFVRNLRNEEGNVPQNVLEPLSSGGPMGGLPRDTRSSVTLNMRSSPAEVRAWLEQRGFSKITVSSLGVLTGDLLLGMSKDEIRTVCPEEAGKVFFQLQAVKSSIALASEPSGMYNGRY